MISIRLTADQGWGDPTPQFGKAVAITETKEIVSRNGIVRADRRTARRSRGRAEAATGISEDIARLTAEISLTAFTLNKGRGRKRFTRGIERAWSIRTGDTGGPAVRAGRDALR
jgi:hypothetical protein